MALVCDFMLDSISLRRNIYRLEILGSYNDEDIYLFDATHSDGADAIHHYYGHRNSNTGESIN